MNKKHQQYMIALGLMIIVSYFLTRPVSIYPGATFCYQESATEASPCGGLDSGAYNIASTTDISGVSVFANYTIPPGYTHAFWQAKARGSVGTRFWNSTVPATCLSGETLQLRLVTSTSAGTQRMACLDSAGWQVFYYYKDPASGSSTNGQMGKFPFSKMLDGDWTTAFDVVHHLKGGYTACSGGWCLVGRIFDEAVWWISPVACPAGYIGARTCSGNNVVQTYQNQDCTTEVKTISECSTCIAGECVTICTPGYIGERSCSGNHVIQTYKKEDCTMEVRFIELCDKCSNGACIICTPGYTGARSCSGNNVVQTWQHADCTSQTQILEACAISCAEGACTEPVTCVPGYTTNATCQGNSIVRTYMNTDCSTETKTILACEHGCADGVCVVPIDSRDEEHLDDPIQYDDEDDPIQYDDEESPTVPIYYTTDTEPSDWFQDSTLIPPYKNWEVLAAAAVIILIVFKRKPIMRWLKKQSK
jgi:hypothetical protein